MSTILVIEDEEPIREGLKDALSSESFKVLTAKDAETGLNIINSKKPDLILLDIRLPGLNGFDLCKKVRSESNMTPIIMLTAKNTETDKVVGLELGADDYVTKPFSVRELISRIKAILRRLESKPVSKELIKFEFGDVKIDFKEFKAEKNKKKLSLSKTEFKIVKFFITHKGEVISRDTFLDNVWGYDEYPSTRTIDNFIAKLRSKIENDPKKPKHLFTIYGVGYKFIT